MNTPLVFFGRIGYQQGMTLSPEFNKKADVILVGAVHSGAQSSVHIRARQQLECNGYIREPGYLQRFDLATFCSPWSEMAAVRQYVNASPFFETNSGIAYRFRHYNGELQTIHGVILTDDNHNIIRRFDREDLGLGGSAKSSSVLDFCKKFVCNSELQAACGID